MPPLPNAERTDRPPGAAACVHIDLDSLWVIGRFHGFESATDPDPVLHGAVPRFLELLDGLDMRATFFVTGRDAAAESARPLLREIAEKGHEIANHSMTHPPNFNSLNREELRAEIEESSRAIGEATGRAPAGFRAPTFNVSGAVLDVLEEAGYAYDSSVLPSPVAPFYALSRTLSGKTPFAYGRVAHCMAPLLPYHPDRERTWKRGGRAIWEVPVSVMPLSRLPFHASYVLKGGKWLFDLGFRAYRMTRAPLIYLLHAKDLFDLEDAVRDPERAVRLSSRKGELIAFILREIRKHYRTMTTVELLEEIRRGEEARP